MYRRLLILGATGDLTSRLLIPGIARLIAAGKLPQDFELIAAAKQDLDSESFRRKVDEALRRHCGDLSGEIRDAVLARIHYRRADATRPEDVRNAVGKADESLIAYLALPPEVFGPAIEALAQLGLPPESRVVVEKPFGKDLHAARELNELLHRTFEENRVFRIDHFLHKQTVQNILGLRFANRPFEYLWNREHVERVEIVWDVALALEGRAGYYDRAGALRDMIQNHLLQMLALAAMEAPLRLEERELRDRKADVLRAVRRPSLPEVREHAVRARYTSGRIGDRRIEAYAESPGVSPERQTETFAEITLWIDNWRWAGVPFTLRTGKALGTDRRDLSIHFRRVPHMAFQAGKPAANVLRLQFDPDRLSFRVNLNGAGDPFELESVDLDAEYPPQELPAYARLLLTVIEGETTFSIRGDEAEESWEIVQPILDAWEAGETPLLEYPAGSAGPDRRPSPKRRVG